MRTFSTVELTQQVGTVTYAASKEPVAITHHRKPRYVLMSMDDFEKLRDGMRPRKAFGAGEAPQDLSRILAFELERRIEENPDDE